MKAGELIGKLDHQAEEEIGMFSGEAARRFFIEQVGAGSVDGLLDMFSAGEHNESWDAERQKYPADVRKLEADRRAVAFMGSGKLGVYRRYRENELSARIAGRARCLWRRNALGRSRQLLEGKG